MEDEHASTFPRASEVAEADQASAFEITQSAAGIPLQECNVFALIRAFQRIVKKLEVKTSDEKHITEERFTVSDKMEQLMERIDLPEFRGRMLFTELFEPMTSKVELVATFLALLELVRLKQLRVMQEAPEGEIEILKQMSNFGALDPSATKQSSDAATEALDSEMVSRDLEEWDHEDKRADSEESAD